MLNTMWAMCFEETSETMRTADWLTACKTDLFNDQPSIGWHNG
jgi:hypothetical protein